MPRKAIFAPVILALLIAPSARAGGLNLRWDHCLGDGGVQNKSFACDTNAGAETLVATFFPPTDLDAVSSVVSTLEIATASATLPAWWGLVNFEGCRRTALTMSPIPPGPMVGCQDWSVGTASGAILSYDSAIGPNDASLVVATSVPPGGSKNLCGCFEFGAATLTISHEKTVGAGSCGGCSIASCIHFKSAAVTTFFNGTHIVTITGPAAGPSSDIATWQGGAGVPALPDGACAGAVPVRSATWGAVRALYR